MPLFIKETLEMFCPICEKEHGMYKVVEMAVKKVLNDDVDVERYFVKEIII